MLLKRGAGKSSTRLVDHQAGQESNTTSSSTANSGRRLLLAAQLLYSPTSHLQNPFKQHIMERYVKPDSAVPADCYGCSALHDSTTSRHTR
jgi:hypothetical protein